MREIYYETSLEEQNVVTKSVNGIKVKKMTKDEAKQEILKEHGKLGLKSFNDYGVLETLEF